MAKVTLTDRFVASATSGPTGRAAYHDASTPGLVLRVSKSGKRTWSFVFWSPKTGQRARLTFGSFPRTSLATARAHAIEAGGYIDADKDPRDAFSATDASAVTVEMLIDSFVEKHVRPNLRTAANFEQRFKRNVTPIVGNIRLADLHRRDINRCLDEIVRRGSLIEANRVHAAMSAMFSWATRRGDLDRNPMQGMGKPSTETGPRERHLSDTEIFAVWNALPIVLAKSVASQRILKLCLATGQRIGEVTGMRRDEVDFKKSLWSLPASRTKNASPHKVPLPPLAMSIIKDALDNAGDDAAFVFPSNDEDEPKALNAHAIGRTLARAQAPTKERPLGRFGLLPWHAHDLRRTCLTGLAALGVAPMTIAAIANHRSVTRGGVTFMSYVRHDFLREKREAIELWGLRLEAIIAGRAARVMPEVKPQKADGA